MFLYFFDFTTKTTGLVCDKPFYDNENLSSVIYGYFIEDISMIAVILEKYNEKPVLA